MSPLQNRQLPQSAKHNWSRRECLRAMGGALLTASTSRPGNSSAASRNLRTDAKTQIQLGIDTGVYRSLPMEDAIRRIREDGFSNVLTDFTFADVHFDPRAPDWADAKKITSCFQRHGVRVATIFGYYNVVDPDLQRRRRGEQRMEFYIANWQRLGCPVISTETGTLNRRSEWLESPENETDAAYAECRGVFERLAAAAEKTGAVIAIESYWRNIISSIDRVERLFRDVPSPALKLVMDPCNYYRKEDLPRMQILLQDMFRRLSDRIVIAHAKDVKASESGTDLPAAGQGVLDYPLYLSLLDGLNRPMDLILEHLSLPDVGRTRDFVLEQLLQQARRVGLE